MESQIKKFCNWLLSGQIEDLEYQVQLYRKQLAEQIDKTNRCKQEQAERVNKLVHDNNQMMLKIKEYREKEERIKSQKRAWKDRQKQAK